MNTHPYLRAYMAGIFVPSLALLVALTVFSLTRLVLQVPIPLERVIIFPMALVPMPSASGICSTYGPGRVAICPSVSMVRCCR